MKSLQDLVEETQQSLANSLRPVTGFFEIGVPVSENTPESQWADNYAAYETLLALYGQTLWAEINNGIEDHPEVMATDIGMLTLALRHIKTELGPNHPDTLRFIEALLKGDEKKLKVITFRLTSAAMSKKLDTLLEEETNE